jgi:hypothetical protein
LLVRIKNPKIHRLVDDIRGTSNAKPHKQVPGVWAGAKGKAAGSRARPAIPVSVTNLGETEKNGETEKKKKRKKAILGPFEIS